MNIGYARVSTIGQDTAIQEASLRALGCSILYMENISGKDTNRPELQRMIDNVQAGDVVYVTKLDRLARNTKDALFIADSLKDKGVGLVCMDLGQTDINSDFGRMIYTVIAAVGEFERKRILQRTQEGREKAMANGVKFGKPVDDELHTSIVDYWNRGMNKKAIAEHIGCSRTTVHKVIEGIQFRQ